MRLLHQAAGNCVWSSLKEGSGCVLHVHLRRLVCDTNQICNHTAPIACFLSSRTARLQAPSLPRPARGARVWDIGSRKARIEVMIDVGAGSPGTWRKTMSTAIKFGTSGWRAIVADEFTVANIRLAVAGGCAPSGEHTAGSQSRPQLLCPPL